MTKQRKNLVRGASAYMENVPPKQEPRYTTMLSQRLRELLLNGDAMLSDISGFTYSWDHGYEKYSIQTDGYGSMTYSGMYHPDIYCEPEPGKSFGPEGGICMWCGSVVHGI